MACNSITDDLSSHSSVDMSKSENETEGLTRKQMSPLVAHKNAKSELLAQLLQGSEPLDCTGACTHTIHPNDVCLVAECGCFAADSGRTGSLHPSSLPADLTPQVQHQYQHLHPYQLQQQQHPLSTQIDASVSTYAYANANASPTSPDPDPYRYPYPYESPDPYAYPHQSPWLPATYTPPPATMPVQTRSSVTPHREILAQFRADRGWLPSSPRRFATSTFGAVGERLAPPGELSTPQFGLGLGLGMGLGLPLRLCPLAWRRVQRQGPLFMAERPHELESMGWDWDLEGQVDAMCSDAV